MTHCDRVLALLSDGQPHHFMEGYRLGVMLHSRVADLRKRGHRIRCWHEEDGYYYQLQSPEPEPTAPYPGIAPAPCAPSGSALSVAQPPASPFSAGRMTAAVAHGPGEAAESQLELAC